MAAAGPAAGPADPADVLRTADRLASLGETALKGVLALTRHIGEHAAPPEQQAIAFATSRQFDVVIPFPTTTIGHVPASLGGLLIGETMQRCGQCFPNVLGVAAMVVGAVLGGGGAGTAMDRICSSVHAPARLTPLLDAAADDATRARIVSGYMTGSSAEDKMLLAEAATAVAAAQATDHMWLRWVPSNSDMVKSRLRLLASDDAVKYATLLEDFIQAADLQDLASQHIVSTQLLQRLVNGVPQAWQPQPGSVVQVKASASVLVTMLPDAMSKLHQVPFHLLQLLSKVTMGLALRMTKEELQLLFPDAGDSRDAYAVNVDLFRLSCLDAHQFGYFMEMRKAGLRAMSLDQQGAWLGANFEGHEQLDDARQMVEDGLPFPLVLSNLLTPSGLMVPFQRLLAQKDVWRDACAVSDVAWSLDVLGFYPLTAVVTSAMLVQRTKTLQPSEWMPYRERFTSNVHDVTHIVHSALAPSPAVLDMVTSDKALLPLLRRTSAAVMAMSWRFAVIQ